MALHRMPMMLRLHLVWGWVLHLFQFHLLPERLEC
jgi:hypothetical protein